MRPRGLPAPLPLATILASVLLCACIDGDPPVASPVPLSRLSADRTYLRDTSGRYIFFHGVNVAGSTKVPARGDKNGAPTNEIPTYVGKPFDLANAATELKKIRDMGFNSMRLLVIWEGIMPRSPKELDKNYLTYLREVVRMAGDYGLYVLVDMHQDIFSRHLLVKYAEETRYGDPGSLEATLLALANTLRYPYTDAVRGDGAPRWVVEACLQEKNMGSASWGIPRILSGLGSQELYDIYQLYQKLTGATSTGTPNQPWVLEFLSGLPAKFEVDESTDMLPFTNWGLAMTLSLDVARCYACLFAGDKVFPKLRKDGKNVKEYLQSAYATAFAAVAEQMKGLPNVMGYDLMNEPGGNFIVLAAAAGAVRAGVITGAKTVLENLLGTETGDQVYSALVTLKLLPADASAATLKKWGLDQLDVMAVLGLNNGFDDNYLRPFYDRVGKAILEKDPDALFFIESTLNFGSILGGAFGGVGGFWEVPMTIPASLAGRVVYAPHWYPDIYPFLGFDQAPREFTNEQVRYRSYKTNLTSAKSLASYSLGNVPVVFGEFGTYFNFNNKYTRDAKTEKYTYTNSAKAADYSVSAYFLNNYLESFEEMFQSRILWCYSPDNDERYGDHWNKEDFSVVGPDGKPRAELAWARPYARALAGKPISTTFNSDYHYYDPDKGKQIPKREFEVRYASKETSAPTEIVVPLSQYGDGFYVWVSDGTCTFESETSTLYHLPSTDEPDTVHWVKIRPPLPNDPADGWSYFFKGNRSLTGR
jgi:hypothetical protein